MESYFIVIICYYFKRYKTIPGVEARDTVLKKAPDVVLRKSPGAAEPSCRQKEGLASPEREAGQGGSAGTSGCPQERQASK